MSDVVREYLLQKDELIDALDLERSEHAQQISIAEVKISNLRSEHVREIAELDTWMSELEKEVADLKKKLELTFTWAAQADVENIDLQQRISELTAQLQDIATADTADWCRPEAGLQGMAREALLKANVMEE
jgi:regulator of replication initiation timing